MFLTKQGEAPPSSPLQATVNHNLNLPQADDVQVVAEQRVVVVVNVARMGHSIRFLCIVCSGGVFV